LDLCKVFRITVIKLFTEKPAIGVVISIKVVILKIYFNLILIFRPSPSVQLQPDPVAGAPLHGDQATRAGLRIPGIDFTKLRFCQKKNIFGQIFTLKFWTNLHPKTQHLLIYLRITDNNLGILKTF
jgi:hypothetical protein